MDSNNDVNWKIKCWKVHKNLSTHDILSYRVFRETLIMRSGTLEFRYLHAPVAPMPGDGLSPTVVTSLPREYGRNSSYIIIHPYNPIYRVILSRVGLLVLRRFRIRRCRHAARLRPEPACNLPVENRVRVLPDSLRQRFRVVYNKTRDRS